VGNRFARLLLQTVGENLISPLISVLALKVDDVRSMSSLLSHALQSGKALVRRSPDGVCPWTHVHALFVGLAKHCAVFAAAAGPLMGQLIAVRDVCCGCACDSPILRLL
jgi:hypothetical protein